MSAFHPKQTLENPVLQALRYASVITGSFESSIHPNISAEGPVTAKSLSSRIRPYATLFSTNFENLSAQKSTLS